MYKLLQLLAFSILLLVPLGAQNAFAGGDCLADPSMVSETVAPGASSEVVAKIINCNEDITSIEIDVSDCDANGIQVSFENKIIDQLLWSGDETITNTDVAPGTMKHCKVMFNLETLGGGANPTQEIWVTSPEPKPTPVGGEFLSIDSTALLLGTMQTGLIWWLPAVVIAGSAAAFFKLRSKNS